MLYQLFLGSGIVLLVVCLAIAIKIRRNRERKEQARRERVAKIARQLEDASTPEVRAVDNRLASTNGRTASEARPSKRPPGSETAGPKSKSFHA